MPQRIQRKRTAGWRTPQCSCGCGGRAIYVGRPTRWGSPFQVQDFLMFGALDEDHYAGWCMDFLSHVEALHASVDLYRDLVSGIWNPTKVDQLGDQPYARLYGEVQAWRKRIGGHPLEVARAELRGHDLSCFCPLDWPCHADVLLEIANGDT